MEIERGVIEAGPYFDCISGDPLSDPRTRLLVEDGRVHLTYAEDRYDVIISEPSNPWMAGIANLFTREFYEIVRERLTPGGVLTQWIQNYDLSEEAFAAVLSALHASFPHLLVFQTNPSDFIVLASQEPLRAPWERVTERFAVPGVRASLARANVRDPRELGFFLVAPEQAVIGTAAEAAEQNTDDNAWLEHHAPVQMMQRLFRGERAGFAARALAEKGAPYRAGALSEIFPGIPYESALEAVVWYPHRMEPGAFEAGFYSDPWQSLRTIQAPALVRSLRGQALADSVARWEEEGARHHGVRAQVARALEEARYRNEVARTLPEALRTAPDLPIVRFEEGRAAFAAGDTAAAHAAYLDVLDHPHSPVFYYALVSMAELSFSAGDPAAALRWADAAAAHNPYYANGWVIGAQLRMSGGDPAGARRRVEEGLRFNPRHQQLEQILVDLPG
jgi:hypothetical protein